MFVRTPTDFGAIIRQSRHAHGLDQQTLAERVGVSRQWLIDVERGKPRAELGLVLRTLDVLSIRLAVEEGPVTPGSQGPPIADIDAIIENARRPSARAPRKRRRRARK